KKIQLAFASIFGSSLQSATVQTWMSPAELITANRSPCGEKIGDFHPIVPAVASLGPARCVSGSNLHTSSRPAGETNATVFSVGEKARLLPLIFCVALLLARSQI